MRNRTLSPMGERGTLCASGLSHPWENGTHSARQNPLTHGRTVHTLRRGLTLFTHREAGTLRRGLTLSSHTREAYPAYTHCSHTPEGIPGIYTTVVHTPREAYPAYTPLYTHPRGIPGIYTTVYTHPRGIPGIYHPVYPPERHTRHIPPVYTHLRGIHGYKPPCIYTPVRHTRVNTLYTPVRHTRVNTSLCTPCGIPGFKPPYVHPVVYTRVIPPYMPPYQPNGEVHPYVLPTHPFHCWASLRPPRALKPLRTVTFLPF